MRQRAGAVLIAGLMVTILGGRAAAQGHGGNGNDNGNGGGMGGPACGTGGPSMEHLGRMVFFDENLSANRNQSCGSCHADVAGWTGPDDENNAFGGVYEGSYENRFGNRRPPTAAYMERTPILRYEAEGKGFIGGAFLDGRATGWDLGSALADQARAPFLNPVEQALPHPAAVVERVCDAHYGQMFRRLFGQEACEHVDQAFANIALSLAAFQSGAPLSRYASKFDAVQAGTAKFSEEEQAGFALFTGKARCANCHGVTAAGADGPALFTDFSYGNLGVPRNPDNPFYGMDAVAVDGRPINSEAERWTDPGLGGFIAQLAEEDGWRDAPFVPASVLALDRSQLRELADANYGHHRVPTLRNVDKRPQPAFTRAYMHNGYFKTLRGVVHFYNTRDVLPQCDWDATEAEALAEGCWPAAEVSEGMQAGAVGDLQLSSAEEDALVAFIRTLTDEAPVCGGPSAGMGGHMGGQGMGMNH